MTRAQLTAFREASARTQKHKMARHHCYCDACRADREALADLAPAVSQWIADAQGAGSGFDHTGDMS